MTMNAANERFVPKVHPATREISLNEALAGPCDSAPVAASIAPEPLAAAPVAGTSAAEDRVLAQPME